MSCKLVLPQKVITECLLFKFLYIGLFYCHSIVFYCGYRNNCTNNCNKFTLFYCILYILVVLCSVCESIISLLFQFWHIGLLYCHSIVFYFKHIDIIVYLSLCFPCENDKNKLINNKFTLLYCVLYILIALCSVCDSIIKITT